MKDRTGLCRRRDRGDLLLGEDIYYVILLARGPISPSPWFSFAKKGGLEDPPRLQTGKVFSLSVGSVIMVAPEPALADALPFLSYSGFIRKVI